MKRFQKGIRFLILFSLLSSVQYVSFSQRDTLIISERVGKEIDSYERCYFNLFSEVSDFKSAYIYRQENKSLTMIIRLEGTAGNRDSSSIISDTLLKDLDFYFENFEKLFIDQSLEKKIISPKLWTIVQARQRYLPPEKIEWTDYKEEKHSGFLILCRDDYFLVMPTDNIYDWRNFKYNIKLIKSNHVEIIGSQKVKGNIEKIRDIILKSFDVSFRDDLYGGECSIPTELKNFIEFRQSKFTDTNIVRNSDMDEPFKLSILGKFCPTEYYLVNSSFLKATKGNDEIINEFIGDNSANYFALGILLTQNELLSYALDFTWSKYISNHDLDYFFKFINFDLYLKYRFFNYKNFAVLNGNLNMSLNLGLYWSLIHTDNSSYKWIYQEPRYHYELNTDGINVFGLYISYTISYSFSKYLSLECGFGFRSTPNSVVLQGTLYDYGRAYNIKSDNLNFSNVFCSIGLMYNIYIPQ